MGTLSKLTDFLDRLDESDIHYTLQSISEGAVCVSVTVPGQRWEVEFHADGDIEIEVFESDGEVRDESALEDLFERAEIEEEDDDDDF